MKGNLAALVAAVAAGRPLIESASAGGVSVSTAQRRLRNPAVMALVHEARVELTRQSMGRSWELRDVALDCLADLLAGQQDPAVKLRIVEVALRNAAAADSAALHERVLEIRRRLDLRDELDSHTRTVM